jgi:hypothetical protein
MWEPWRLATFWAFTARTGITLPFIIVVGTQIRSFGRTSEVLTYDVSDHIGRRLFQDGALDFWTAVQKWITETTVIRSDPTQNQKPYREANWTTLAHASFESRATAPEVHAEGLRKTTNNLSLNSCPCRDSNRVSVELIYKLSHL